MADKKNQVNETHREGQDEANPLKPDKQANKRPGETIDNYNVNSPTASKVQKTRQQNLPFPGYNEGISLSQLTVGDLNALMVFNFRQMQAQSMFELMANMKIMINETMKFEVSRLEKMMDEKMQKMKEELLQPNDLNKRVAPIELKQLETDIEIASIKQSVDALAEKTSETGGIPNTSHSVIIKNLDISNDEFVSEVALETDVTTLIEEGLKLENINVSAVKRLRPIVTKNGTKPGHVLLTVGNKEEQVAILKSKNLLRNGGKYNNVWIEADKPKEVRAMERNCRTLLKELGKENEYKFKGSTLVKKGNQAQNKGSSENPGSSLNQQ